MERSIRRAFAVGLEHWAKAEQLAQRYSRGNEVSRDPDGRPRECMISQNAIPRRYAHELNTKHYDARQLRTMIGYSPHNPSVPHTRRPLTDAEIIEIGAKCGKTKMQRALDGLRWQGWRPASQSIDGVVARATVDPNVTVEVSLTPRTVTVVKKLWGVNLLTLGLREAAGGGGPEVAEVALEIRGGQSVESWYAALVAALRHSLVPVRPGLEVHVELHPGSAAALREPAPARDAGVARFLEFLTTRTDADLIDPLHGVFEQPAPAPHTMFLSLETPGTRNAIKHAWPHVRRQYRRAVYAIVRAKYRRGDMPILP